MFGLMGYQKSERLVICDERTVILCIIYIFDPTHTGEWWNGDVEEVESEMLKSGGGPNISDAYTINGLPGPLYPCSAKGTIILHFL